MLSITDREEVPTHKHNLVLFPKTYQYYQMELTRLLETEQYAEAFELLKFLLQFEGEGEDIRSEWQALHDWLQMVFPELNAQNALLNHDNIHNEDERQESFTDEIETETELLQAQLAMKQQMDATYVSKLLDILKQSTVSERTWLVLEQLANVTDKQLDDELLTLLETESLHSLVQFGLLQTLKRRGVKGKAAFWKLGEHIVVEIEDTPMDYESFPEALRLPVVRVEEVSGISEPSLAYFAQEVWLQFLRAVYGSTLYHQLQGNDSSNRNVWAAALHRVLAGFLHLGENDVDVKRMYAVDSEQRIVYEQALRELAKSRHNQ